MIRIRKMDVKDLEWARKLRNDNREFFLNTKRISKKNQSHWFKNLKYPFFVIMLQDKPVGTLGIKVHSKSITLENVLIDQKYRRKGVLRNAVELVKRLEPKKTMYLEVKYSNLVAFTAYTKLGFKPIRITLCKE